MTRLFGVLIWLLGTSFSAQAQTPFYQGKTIRIVTGYPAGDVNDLWPRLITQHMGKYIPGNPIFIVQHRECARRIGSTATGVGSIDPAPLFRQESFEIQSR